MADTISFPTAASTNTVTASNLFADDGTATTGIWDSAHADITLSSFSSLSIPAGATIDGIEVLIEGVGNTQAGDPEVKVYNGSSWSSNKVFLAILRKRPVTAYDPGWGANNDLWGLSWDATTAAGIQIQIDSSTMASGGRMFLDYMSVRVTYTAAAS